MKVTRILDGLGKTMTIPIAEQDQMVGISIAGEYDGLIQIVGMIDENGRELDVICYDRNGEVVEITNDPPLDFFIDDVGGLAYIKIIAVQWNSGRLDISAVTSSAKRKKSGSSGGSDPSTTVEVSNFPDVQPVSGPLTNGQLRSAPVDVDVLSMPDTVAQELTLSTILQHKLGFDSLGNPLPLLFNSVASVLTFVDGLEEGVKIISSEVKVVGSETFTKTYGNDGICVTSISPWVRS